MGLGTSAVATTADADEREQVYQRKGRDGRLVYTNIGNVSEGGVHLQAMELGDLLHLDLAAVPQEKLRVIDQRIDDIHTATRAGKQCAAIRTASEGSTADVFWQEQRQPILLCSGLLALAGLLGLAGGGMLIGAARIALFLGGAFFGYTAVAGGLMSRDAFAAGLHACSSDLPPAEPKDAAVVKQRLSAAADFQRSVQGVVDGRAGRIDQAMDSALR
jgi:hypothetical protein